jgi:hypothetical protein
MPTQVQSTRSMPQNAPRKRRGPRLSPKAKGKGKGKGKSASAPRGKASADPLRASAADGVPERTADAQAGPAPPTSAPAGVALGGMGNAPVAPPPAPLKPAPAPPPPAVVGGRAVGKGDAEASASSSEEEDDDDSGADAGSPAPAKRAGGKGSMAWQKGSRQDLKRKRAEAFDACVDSQRHFHEVQRVLCDKFPDTKRIKLRLVSANLPREKSLKTPEEQKAITLANEQRRWKLHGEEFSAGYFTKGAVNANGGSSSNGGGATVYR